LVAAVLLAGCAPGAAQMRLPTPQPAEPVTPTTPAEPVNPGKTFQWMGSGEAAALSRQGWQALARYVIAEAETRPADSVVLAEGATPDTPRFVP